MKPFLSIVVPCYNSRRYIIRLLQSIYDCKLKYEQIEVILADDCSTESYDDLVEPFKEKLRIVQCKTPHNSGNPTNARELGASLATGVYLTFMDHDDWLDPEGIARWLEFVTLTHDFPDYVICGFRQCNEAGETEFEKYGCLDFLHGKFFKLEEFYRKCNIHFKPDIFHKEDTWVCAQANCNCIKYNIEPLFTDFCTHIWFNNERSLSHRIDAAERSGDTTVTMERMETNMMIEREIYFKFFDEGSMPLPVATTWFIRSLINLYFDVELNHGCYEALRPMIKDYIADIKKRLNMDNDAILMFAFGDGGFVFKDQLREFMEMHEELKTHEGFSEFLIDMSGE